MALEHVATAMRSGKLEREGIDAGGAQPLELAPPLLDQRSLAAVLVGLLLGGVQAPEA